MTTLLRKTLTGVIAAVSLGAMVVATSTPAAAWGHRWRGGGWGGPGIAAGVIGGLAAGAIIAGAGRPAYAAPVYADPGYGYDDGYAPVCYKEWRPVYRSDGLYLRDRLVRVCN